MPIPTTTPSPNPLTHSFRFLLPFLLALATLIPVALYPGDVAWLIDEPRLIANAFYSNQEFLPSASGLFGNFAVPYGPVPTQIYQLLLLLTHNPFTLVILRGLLCASLTAIGLLWLAKSLRIPTWFAIPFLISPNIIAFQRILWDASFTIPLSALGLAAFADFLKSSRPLSLRISLVATVLLPLNHPQSLPLALPIAAYLLWRHRPQISADRLALSIIAAVLFILHYRYLGTVFNVIHYHLTQSVTHLQYPIKSPLSLSLLSPLLGGNLLSGFDYARSIAPPAGPSWLALPFIYSSLLVYPLIWLGILLSLFRLPSTLRSLRSHSPISTPEIFSAILLLSLFLQFLLFSTLRIPPGPQYFFGTFALHVALAFLGLHSLQKYALALPTSATLLSANTFLTVGAIITTHQYGFPLPCWPTMISSSHGVAQLNHYSDQSVFTDIDLFKRFPQPIRTLRLLSPPPLNSSPPHGRLFLTYRQENGRSTGDLVVQELPENLPLPPSSLLIEITPLPKNWAPDPQYW